jgi:hypothetical protein
VTKERMEWIMGGLSPSKFNKFEKGFINRIEKKQPEDLTESEEANLERIYRARSR